MKHNNKGMFTVELTLIFPVILFSIMGVLWMSMVHYQNIVAGTVAMRTASRTAAYWNYAGEISAKSSSGASAAETLITPSSFTSHDPYRYLFEGLGDGNRTQAAVDYARTLMGNQQNLLKSNENGFEPKVEKTGSILKKYITVSVEKNYVNPLKAYMESCGWFAGDHYTVRAKAPLNNPGEFVRTTSIIYDLFQDNDCLME